MCFYKLFFSIIIINSFCHFSMGYYLKKDLNKNIINQNKLNSEEIINNENLIEKEK